MNFQDLFDGCLLIGPEADLTEVTVDLPTAAGVCLFCHAEDEPILLLYGGNMRQLVRRRLREDSLQEKTRRTRLRPIVRRIWFRRCWSAFETYIAYFHITRAVYPRRYREFFPQLNIWFVHIDLRKAYPFFSRVRVYEPSKGRFWGPFRDGKAASGLVDLLQDMYGLCRCPEVLVNAPHARPCAYGQMGRCQVVCDGTVDRQQYMKLLQSAIEFLDHPAEVITVLRQKMQESAASLKFEEAQKYKKKIDQAHILDTPAYRWVGPMENFHVLACQPGPAQREPGRRGKQVTITTFLISPNQVYQIESFPLDKMAEGCKAVLDHLNLVMMQARENQQDDSGALLSAWCAHLLYDRKNRDKGLYIRVDESLTSELLSRRILAHFGKPDADTSGRLELDSFSLTAKPPENSPDEQ